VRRRWIGSGYGGAWSNHEVAYVGERLETVVLFVLLLHGNGGHGLKETEAGGMVFVLVGKALSLAGSSGSIRGRGGVGASGRWNRYKAGY
jgi:hypothetical protein